MPTARELLERADALMRRNRKRGKRKRGAVPTLTDALDGDAATTLAPTIILPETPAAADPISLDTLGDVPVLTDVVGEAWFESTFPSTAAAAVSGASGDASESFLARDDGPEADAPDPMRTGSDDASDPLPVRAVAAEEQHLLREPSAQPVADLGASLSDTLPPEAATVPAVATVPPAAPVPVAAAEPGAVGAGTIAAPVLDEEFILDIPPAREDERPIPVADVAATVRATAALATLAPGSEEWDALAEELRMQVLQRLDLFTDTGLREQLGERVKPIVDRASAELIETINHELGALVRGYVAEAIEREIESWRKRNA